VHSDRCPKNSFGDRYVQPQGVLSVSSGSSVVARLVALLRTGGRLAISGPLVR
jgi:hypothetical protein